MSWRATLPIRLPRRHIACEDATPQNGRSFERREAKGRTSVSDLAAFSLTGKRILVTGANTGIGQGIAISVARAGGSVIGVGRSAMDETAERIAAVGGRFAAVLFDLSDTTSAGAMLDRIWDESGPLDGLVNNAGIIRRADAVELAEADWDDVMDINLKAVFLLSQRFARRVLAAPGRRGKIVNIASVLSFQGGIRVASYTAAKYGVRMGAKGHQRQRHRSRLYRNQQHRGAARRSRSQRVDPGAHSGRALGPAGRHWRRGRVPAGAGV